jgi:hypothetical protein
MQLSLEIAKSLVKKYNAALAGVEQTKGPFEELSQSLDPDSVARWRSEAFKADEERGEALDIYLLKMEKGWYLTWKPAATSADQC